MTISNYFRIDQFTNDPMTHFIKKISVAVPATIVALALALSSTAIAQTYKPDFATKVQLAGGGTLGGSGTDVTNTMTITASNTAAINWLLPATNGTSGYVLSNNGSGTLSWIDPTASLSIDATLHRVAGVLG